MSCNKYLAATKAIFVALLLYGFANATDTPSIEYLIPPLAASALAVHCTQIAWYQLLSAHGGSLLLGFISLSISTVIPYSFIVPLLLIASVQIVVYHPAAMATGLATYYASPSLESLLFLLACIVFISPLLTLKHHKQ